MRDALIALGLTALGVAAILALGGSKGQAIVFGIGGFGWAAIYAIFPRRR